MGKIADLHAAAALRAVDYRTVHHLTQDGDLSAAGIGPIYHLALEDVERFFQDLKAATMHEVHATGYAGPASAPALPEPEAEEESE